MPQSSRMKIVYLDQLHWIEISRAMHGKETRDGTVETLAHIRQAVANERLLFPLSMAHYFETLKQSDPDRRQRLAEVMLELSAGNTIASPPTVLSHEIRAALVSKLELGIPTAPLQLIGQGVQHALGRSIKMLPDWPQHLSIPEQVRNEIDSEIIDQLEQGFLSGNFDFGDDIQYFPQMNLDAAQKFMCHLTEWRGTATTMSPPELKRKIYAKSLANIQETLSSILQELSITMTQFAMLGEPVWCGLLDMMPSQRTEMHLLMQWAKNAHLQPNLSDLNDWAFLGVAVNYCDLVVTEKQMNDLLQRSEEYASKSTARLTDLLQL